METNTNCRSEEGITVGLIDAVISICRVLKHRRLKTQACSEALKDFQSDEDVKFLMTYETDIKETYSPEQRLNSFGEDTYK